MNRRIKVAQYSGGKLTDLMMKYPYNHGGEVVCAFGKNSCAVVKGIDTIFTCEETFYPWNSHYKITKEIDELAKKNDCTICVTRAQDMNWGYIISTFAGASDNIMKIKRSVVYNFKDYGIVMDTVLDSGSISNLSPELLIKTFTERLGIDTDRSEIDVSRKKIFFE